MIGPFSSNKLEQKQAFVIFLGGTPNITLPFLGILMGSGWRILDLFSSLRSPQDEGWPRCFRKPQILSAPQFLNAMEEHRENGYGYWNLVL